MSLFGKFWKRFRNLRTRQTRVAAVRRRLFAEPLEARELLAADLLVQKLVNNIPSGQSVIAGNLLDYTIKVTNQGDGDAVDVHIDDDLPNFTSVNQTVSGPTVDSDNNQISITEDQTVVPNHISIIIPVIHATEVYEYTFTQQVNPDAVIQGGDNLTITNAAVVTYKDTDNNDLNGFGFTDAIPVIAKADLILTEKKASVSSVNVGNDIQFTVTVDNAGPSDSQNAIVSDALPNGLVLKSIDSFDNTIWTRTDTTQVGQNGTISFKAADFPSAAGSNSLKSTAKFVFTATAVQGNGQLISNTAHVDPDQASAHTTDPDTTNNQKSVSFTVIPPPLPDLKVTKTLASDLSATNGNVVAGTDLTYTITVENTGTTATDANAVKLTDVAPTNTVLVDPQNDFVLVSDTGTSDWIFNSGESSFTKQSALAAGEKATFSMKVHVLANAPSGVSIVNTASGQLLTGQENNIDANQQSTTTPVVRQAGLTLTKTDAVPPTGANPTTAVPGQSITYTITVANPNGPSEVSNASFADDLSALPISNISYTSVATGLASGNSGGSGTVTASAIADTISLPVGGQIVYTVTGTINSSATGSLSNTATVGVPNGTTNTGTPSITDTDQLTPTADLEVTKTTNDTSVVGGTGNITYTITVANRGPSDAQNLDLKDIVPTGITFVSFDQTGGSPTWTQVQSGSGGTVEYTLPALKQSDGTSTFTMVVGTIATTNDFSVTNTVDVKMDTAKPSPDPHPDSASITSQVTAPLAADLAITKSASQTVIAGGTNLTYTLHVTNDGSAPSDTITVTDPFPTVTNGTAAITFVNAPAVTGWTIAQPSAGNGNKLIITSNAGTVLAPKTSQDFTFTIAVPANASNNALITNGGTGKEVTVATTSATHPDVDLSDNTAPAIVTTIQTQADLSVTKSTNNTSVTVGQNIVYTITVGAFGPSNASSVVLTDNIPAGTTYQSFTTSDANWAVEAPNAQHPTSVRATRTTLAPNAAATTFTLTVKTNNNLADNTVISNVATVSSATAEPSPDGHPNTTGAVLTTVHVPFDFGDAPASYELNASNVSDPARHSVSTSLHLGALVDTEQANQPNPPGLGDNVNGQNDEDGVAVPGALLVNRGAVITVTSSGTGKLDGWIDYNKNGRFDPAEQIVASYPVFAGPNTISFNVPSTALTGNTFARFRLSSAGGLGPTGLATDGEVEDYGVTINTVSPGTTLVIPDPENPGQNMLSITGTANADIIAVNQLRTPLLQVQVVFNGKTSSPINISTFRRIVVYAGAGNDTVNINVAMPALIHGEAGADRLTGGGNNDEIYGDAGNDTLNGGGGNDILIGGADNDSLNGGTGRDLLIGGLGVDSLLDTSGDNILIGGTTDLDNNHAAVQAVMSIWGNTIDSYQTRISKLGPLINSSTVHNDNVRDKLDGGAGHTGHDWFLDFSASNSVTKDLILNFIASKDKKN